MKDLLRDAIADAKAVRETAYANAKLAIEEAFTPHLQSIISAKLAEEADGVSEEVEEMTETTDSVDTQVTESDSTTTEVDVQTEATDMEDEDEKELDLESIIAELEEELASSEIGQGDNKEPSTTASSSTTEYPNEGDLYEASSEEEDEKEMKETYHKDNKEDEKDKDEMDESIDIQEIIRSLTEEDEDDKKHKDEEDMKKMEALQVELEAAYETIRSLQGTINEVNLLNAKLLYSNKLFKSYTLSESQKRKVIENFDRAKTIREVKLVFTTLGEAFESNTSLKPIKESFASDPIPSTKPSKVITEGNDQATRFKQLAGIIK
jgi:hypothetical protein